MADRYQIITGKVPDPPPTPPKKKSELDFLIEAHDKMSLKINGESDFRNRVNRLYLEGQISDKSYQAMAKKYRWVKPTHPTLREYSVGGSCGLADNGRC